MLTAAYHMLKTGVVYADFTDQYFEARDRTKIAKHLIKRLANLGFQAALSPIPVAIPAQ
jgi:hypothetical protein